MNLDELRASILEHLGVTVTRRPVLDDEGDEAVAVIVTASADQLDAVARWIDSARIGHLVQLEEAGDDKGPT